MILPKTPQHKYYTAAGINTTEAPRGRYKYPGLLKQVTFYRHSCIGCLWFRCRLVHNPRTNSKYLTFSLWYRVTDKLRCHKVKGHSQRPLLPWSKGVQVFLFVSHLSGWMENIDHTFFYIEYIFYGIWCIVFSRLKGSDIHQREPLNRTIKRLYLVCLIKT